MVDVNNKVEHVTKNCICVLSEINSVGTKTAVNSKNYWCLIKERNIADKANRVHLYLIPNKFQVLHVPFCYTMPYIFKHFHNNDDRECVNLLM